MLNLLGAQTGLRENQFGGVKGSGSEHLLVRMWQDILQALEDPRAAVLLTSIAFAKAFNHLDFNHCWSTLRDKGASNGALRVVASFLSDRTMMEKVGGLFSQPKKVFGGVPQGSILGFFLFNCSIDSFETDVRRYYGGSGTNTTAPGGPSPLSVPDEPTAPDYRHLTPFLRIPIEIYKYVDDNVILEKLNFASWFPAHHPTRVTRRPLSYLEERARTARLHLSPIYHLRRRLNGMKIDLHTAKPSGGCIVQQGRSGCQE